MTDQTMVENQQAATENKGPVALTLENLTEERGEKVVGFHTDETAAKSAISEVLQHLAADSEGNIEFDGNGQVSKNKLVQSNTNIETLFTEPLPENHGVLITAISERDTSPEKKGNVTKAVAIYLLPTVDGVMNYGEGKGRDFVANAVEQAFLRKLTPMTKSRMSGEAVSLPGTVGDLVESQRGGADNKAFTKLAPAVVKMLKGKGLDNINPNILKLVLSSKATAQALFPKMENNGRFVALLDVMIKQAKEQQMDVAVFENWKGSRDQTAMAPEADVEFGDDDFAKLAA